MKLEKLRLPNGKCVKIKSENSGQDSNYYTVLIGANGVGKTRIFESLIQQYSQYSLKQNSEEKIEKLIFSTYTLFQRKNSLYKDRMASVYISNFNSKDIILQVSKMYFESQMNSKNQRFSDALPDLLRLLEISEEDKSELKFSVRSLSGMEYRVMKQKVRKTKLSDSLDSLYKLLKERSKILLNPIEILRNKFEDNTDVGKMLESKSYSFREYDEYLKNCYQVLLSLKLMLIDNARKNQYPDNIRNLYGVEDLVKLYTNYFEITPSQARQLLETDYRICKEVGINYFDNLAIQKGKNAYQLIDTFSSGQFAMFTRFLELVSEIRENSLVLIDEPETFLNPKWVFEFVSMLKDTFKNMNCHFIIASQSPFVVGSVKKEDIIKLRKNNEGEVFAEGVESQTLGATFDDILANVFGVDFSDNKVADDYISKIDAKAKGDILEAFEMLPDLAESREKMNLVLRLSSSENKERVKSKIRELEERYFGG